MDTNKTKRHPLQVNSATYDSIREMAQTTGEPMTKIVERAIEHYRYETLLRAHNEAWSRLAAVDPDAVAEFEAEDQMWDRSNSDGFSEFQPPEHI